MIKNKYIGILVIAVFLMLAIVPQGVMLVKKAMKDEVTAEVDLQLHLTMAGFDPVKIEAKKGETITIELINDESGTHHFASDELNFNYLVAPRTKQIVQVTADEEGDFLFFCDVCCGGKTNPSMQGRFVVS